MRSAIDEAPIARALIVVEGVLLPSIPGGPEHGLHLQLTPGRWHPGAAIVGLGQTLRITNDGEDLHRVLIGSPEDPRRRLDIGMPYLSDFVRRDLFQRREVPFEISCWLHAGESTLVAVVENALHTFSGEDGRYELEIPLGTYSVSVLHPDHHVLQLETLDVGDTSLEQDFTLERRTSH